MSVKMPLDILIEEQWRHPLTPKLIKFIQMFLKMPEKLMKSSAADSVDIFDLINGEFASDLLTSIFERQIQRLRVITGSYNDRVRWGIW